MTLTFGATAAAASAAPHALDVSSDGRAFTLTYSDYRVDAGTGDRAPRDMAARWEWFVLPLADHPQGDRFTVAVSGYAVTTGGATGTLVIDVNGLVDSGGFGPGADGGFVRSVERVTSGFDSRLRVGVGVLVAADPGAAVSVTVTAVDGDVSS